MTESRWPGVRGDSLPWVTREQMVEVDRRMIEDLRISLTKMMENAGRCLARLAMDRFDLGSGRPTVLVLAGSGGNGGGALAAARRLHGWGVRVRVMLSADEDVYAGVPATQVASLAAQGIPISALGTGGYPSFGGDPAEEDLPSLFLDGLVGYSLAGDPRGPTAQLIRFANRSAAPVLSLDVPSGVEISSGKLREPSIVADATMTLALPKEGLRIQDAREASGELYLADIGVPLSLYEHMGIAAPPDLFTAGEILRID